MTPDSIGTPRRDALREAWPLLIPAWPFALVLGVLISEGEFGEWAGWSTSWIVFAGAAQLTLVTLYAEVGPASAIVSALVVNARHFMYSAAVSPSFRHQPRWFRFLAPYVLIDQMFAMMISKVDTHPTYYRRYYLVFGALFWSTWQFFVGAGILLGAGLPESWGLDFAVPVLFLGLTVLSLVTRPAVVAAVVGAAVAILTSPLPNRVGLLIGALAGVVAATAVDREPV